MAKGNDYFAMFTENASYTVKAANFVKERLDNFNIDTLDADIRALHEIEHEADVHKHELMRKLLKEFITPIEREDIVELAQQIDNVVDKIEEIFVGFYMFNVGRVRDDAKEMASLVVDAAYKLEDVIREFGNFRKSDSLHSGIIEINRLEEVGDSLYTKAICNLFRMEKDPVRLVRWNKIYDLLEESLDTIEDASEVVESVIMKNS